MRTIVARVVVASFVAALVGSFVRPIAASGKPHPTSPVVASAPAVQLVPVFAFFRVGEAAREQAIRDEAYRAGYAQGQAETNAAASPAGDRPAAPAAVSDASSSPRDGVKPSPAGAAHVAAEGVLRRACVRCHSGAAPAGQLDLTTPGAAPEQRLAVFKAAYTGRMPPNGPPVSDDDVRVLLESLIADESPAKP